MGTRSNGQDNTFSKAFWKLYKDDALPGKHMGVSGSHIRAVLIGLAAHANYSDGKSIEVGQTRIARETCLSISTVKRAMAALVDLGWLVQTKEPTYTEPAHYIIILHGSVHGERSSDTTEFTATGVTDNGESVPCEPSHRSQGTGGSVHSELLPINTNQHQSVVEDAREGARATNTPQQVEEDEEQPLVGHSIDPAALDGIIMELFDRYERPRMSGLSEGLRQRLRAAGLTNEQIPVYIEDRLMEFALTEFDDRKVFEFIRDDAHKWLKVRQPRQPHPDDVERDRKRREDLEELWRMERAASEEADRRTPEEQAAMDIYYKQLAHQFWGSPDEIN